MPMQKSSFISKRQLRFGALVCLIGAFFYCYEFVLRIIPGVLQTELSAAMGHISATLFGQISALYYFAYSPMQMPVGMLMDRFGPRRLLTLACFCCTLGSWLFTMTHSIALVSCGRFLMGFGSSFAFVGVLSLALNWLPRRYFSLVAGLVTTLGMLGIIYGAVEVTHWSALLGWQTVLMVLVFIGLVLSGLMFLVVRDGPQGFQPHTQPLPDFFRNVVRVLTSSKVWVIGLVGACLYTSLSIFGELWGKIYLEQVHHMSKMEAAEALSAMFLGWAVGAPVSGYWSDRSGRRVLPLVVGALCSLVCFCIILYGPTLSHGQVFVLLFLYGVFSGTEIIVFIMAKEHSGAALSGTVFAATNMIVTLGGVIFQPLVGRLLDVFGGDLLIHGEHVYTKWGYQVALSMIPLSLLVVIVLGFFLKDASKASLDQVK